MSDSYILGLNAYDHDVAACLLRNGEIVAAISKERLTRKKHDAGFTGEVTRYCLEAAGIGLDDVELIVRNCYLLPVPEMEARLAATHDPYHLTDEERVEAQESGIFLSDDPRLVTCSHHLAHAYSAFAVSPFERGAVLIVDGIGSHACDALDANEGVEPPHPFARESESMYRFDGGKIETVGKIYMGPYKSGLGDEFIFFDGIGAVYSRVSSYVFGHWNKCGEVMGLAPYGRETMPPLFQATDGGLDVHPWPEALRSPFPRTGDRAWERSASRRGWEDLSRRVQQDTEDALLARAKWLHERTGEKNLVLAGGVALNCVANGRLVEEGPFENVFIQPAAGDDGIAIGCAYYGHLAVKERTRTFTMTHPYLGRHYADADVEDAFDEFLVRRVTTRTKSDRVIRQTAELLAEGSAVGWFQGASEFGPRALGNRSILGDPRDPKMKDKLNAKVKHRQAFRPFAPAVLAELASHYFEGEAESPYMLLAKRVKPAAREKIPGIVHIDGTARVQTVTEESNPFFYALLAAFAEVTGVGVLINTSFNIKGEPIVETPTDAMECFLSTGLDALVIHEWIIRKNALHKFVSPVRRFGKRVGTRLPRRARRRRDGNRLTYSAQTPFLAVRASDSASLWAFLRTWACLGCVRAIPSRSRVSATSSGCVSAVRFRRVIHEADRPVVER